MQPIYRASESVQPAVRVLHSFMQEYPFERLPRVSRTKILNTINLLHFKNEPLWAHIKSGENGNPLLVKVYPEPCRQNEVVCRIDADVHLDLSTCHFEHILINYGSNAIVIPTLNPVINQSSLETAFPHHGFLLRARTQQRLRATGVSCELAQADTSMSGHLIDFTSVAVSVGLDAHSPKGDDAQPFLVRMHKDGRLVFEGRGSLLRRDIQDEVHKLIIRIEPLRPAMPRLRRGKYARNPRVKLLPAPKVSFVHPFSGAKVSYDVHEISTSGFSIQSNFSETALLRGMIIPGLTLIFSDQTTIPCCAQVLRVDAQDGLVAHAFKILDMPVHACVRLCDIIIKSLDVHAGMGQLDDMEGLWDLFFIAAFIYPKKYLYVSNLREAFKENYRHMYMDGKDIFAYVIYADNEQLFGHVSGLRAYQRVWMFQHLVARPMHGKKRIGLEVFRYIYHFFDAAYRLPSFNMDYTLMSFRPDNDFMMYFQGGFCRTMHDPRKCSMDRFAYIYLDIKEELPPLPPGWQICPLDAWHYPRLRASYAQESNGLLLDALGIGRDFADETALEEEYAKVGLFRRTTSYALCHGDELKASFILDESNPCLNLSDLLNCIKVLVHDQTDLPWEILHNGMARLGRVYGNGHIPVLIFPPAYLEQAGVGFDRSYYLWLLDNKHAGAYVQYMKKAIDIPRAKLLLRMFKATLQKTGARLMSAPKSRPASG